MANLAGFSTIIVDNREAFANRDRFPEADEIFAEEYEDISPKLTIRDTSYLIIVTRGHRDDMRVLRWAVDTPARYIAMIGSKRKVIGVVKELEKERISRSAFDRVFAPMGFDIGAITPEEIAVSVVAEMIAVRRNPDSDWRAVAKSIFTHDAEANLEAGRYGVYTNETLPVLAELKREARALRLSTGGSSTTSTPSRFLHRPVPKALPISKGVHRSCAEP